MGTVGFRGPEGVGALVEDQVAVLLHLQRELPVVAREAGPLFRVRVQGQGAGPGFRNQGSGLFVIQKACVTERLKLTRTSALSLRERASHRVNGYTW